MMLQMTPFEAYKLFLAVKMHFTQPSFDFFKYNGTIKANYESFEKRKDKFYFQKLAKQKDLKEYLVSNFVDQGVQWIGDLVSEESETVFKLWQRRNQSLTYMFTNEIFLLDEDFMSYFKVVDGQHPKLLTMYKQKKISIETLVILNDMLSFFPIWDKKIKDPIIWPSIRDKCLKYQPFIRYDKVRIKNLVKDLISHINKP
jgi:hypothetical protein